MASPTKDKKYDPILDRSLSGWFLVSAGLLVLVTVWAVYDEIVTRRPWKGHQAEFKEIATRKYDEDLQNLNKVYESSEYKSARKTLDDANAAFAADPKVKAVDESIAKAQIDYDKHRIMFQVLRGELQESQYFWEMARGDAARQEQMLKRIKVMEDGDPTAKDPGRKMGTNELARKMAEADARKRELKAERLALRKDVDAASRKVAELVAPVEKVQRLRSKVQNESLGIKQIVNDELRLVDRCESCHVAIRMQGFPKGERFHGAYTSHPGDFLKNHNVDLIGCTTCHRGQGYATSNAHESHGIDKYWLWPMLKGADAQANCVKCHDQQYSIPEGERISRGKQLVQDLGCWGCHKIRGFDREENRLSDARLAQEAIRRDLKRVQDQAGANPNDPSLTARVADLQVQLGHAAKTTDEAAREFRQVAPDLTRVKSKVYPGWLEVWLTHPKGWRPSTTMPNFLLAEDEIKAIAAYLWQNSEGPSLERHPLGPPEDAADKAEEGQHLFRTVGCVACHQIAKKTKDGKLELPGGDFGPDLSKVGEKITYEYLVEWILEPRKFQPHGRMPTLRLTREQAEKIAAYLTTVVVKDPNRTEPEIPKRDLGYLEDMKLADYGRNRIQRYGCFGCHNIKGFEAGGKPCVELTAVHAKLMHQFDFGLIEKEIKEKYGVHDKHEWHSYGKMIWLREKLRDPRQWDKGRDVTKKGDDRLKMPNFELNDEDLDAITCFLQALDGEEVALKYRYRPGGAKEALIEGEKVIRKYNCTGCHQFEVEKYTLKSGALVWGLPKSEDEESIFLQLHRDSPELGKKTAETVKLERAQIARMDPAWGGTIIPHVTKALLDAEEIEDEVEAGPHLPPMLAREGEKVQSSWLFHFLKNPYSLRPWIKIKMPTFDMSEAEIAAIGRYFAAKSAVAYPFEYNREKHREYMADRLKQNPDYQKLGATLFGDQPGFNCQACHVKGTQTPKGKPDTWAPDLTMAKERLRPEWIRGWLVDPAKIQPGTRMPRFQWGTIKEIPGTPEEQVEAVKDLLMYLNDKDK